MYNLEYVCMCVVYRMCYCFNVYLHTIDQYIPMLLTDCVCSCIVWMYADIINMYCMFMHVECLYHYIRQPNLLLHN